MSVLRRALVRATGNGPAQRLLERTVFVAQYLMGVGAGSEVGESGERAVLDLVRARRPAPWRVFDVGANRGQYARLVLDQLGADKVELHCFEPSAHTYALLESAIGSSGARLNQTALGREAGAGVLHFDAAGSGLASLTRRRLDHFGIDFEGSEPVRVATLDEYCAAHAIDRIDLLKLDVEGHELDVLAGGRDMLERGAIDAIVFEFGGCNIDTRCFLQDFFYFFREAGMTLHRVTPAGYLRRLDGYAETAEQFRTTNFLALRGRA